MESVAKSDLELIIRQVNNIEKSYNDYILETGEDTKLTIRQVDGSLEEFEAADILDKWQKTIVEEKSFFEIEDSDLKLKKFEMGKNLPKITISALEGKGKYIQFALALQEQTKEFTTPITKEFEGDKNKLLQLIKNVLFQVFGSNISFNGRSKFKKFVLKSGKRFYNRFYESWKLIRANH